MKFTKAVIVVFAGLLGGCAQLEFGEGYQKDAVTFYDPTPFLMISYNKDCEPSGSIIALPDPSRERHVKPRPGYGSSTLTAKFSNGLLTEFGQTGDTKSADTITAATGLIKQVMTESVGCKPGAIPPPVLRRIRAGADGTLSLDRPLAETLAR